MGREQHGGRSGRCARRGGFRRNASLLQSNAAYSLSPRSALTAVCEGDGRPRLGTRITPASRSQALLHTCCGASSQRKGFVRQAVRELTPFSQTIHATGDTACWHHTRSQAQTLKLNHNKLSDRFVMPAGACSVSQKAGGQGQAGRGGWQAARVVVLVHQGRHFRVRANIREAVTTSKAYCGG